MVRFCMMGLLNKLGMILVLSMGTGAFAGQSSYVRLLPNNGNNVYPASGLLHPYEGCQEGRSDFVRFVLGEVRVVRSAADAERSHARQRWD